LADLIPEQELTMRLEGGWDESDARAGFTAPFPVKVVESLEELPKNNKAAQVVLIFDEGCDDPKGVFDMAGVEVVYAGENEDWDGAMMGESTSYELLLVLMSNLPRKKARVKFEAMIAKAEGEAAKEAVERAEESFEEAATEAAKHLTIERMVAMIREVTN
jgi:hypothetical protein